MKIDVFALVSILAISVHAELVSTNSIANDNGLRLQKRQLFDKIKKFFTKKQSDGDPKSNRPKKKKCGFLCCFKRPKKCVPSSQSDELSIPPPPPGPPPQLSESPSVPPSPPGPPPRPLQSDEPSRSTEIPSTPTETLPPKALKSKAPQPPSLRLSSPPAFETSEPEPEPKTPEPKPRQNSPKFQPKLQDGNTSSNTKRVPPPIAPKPKPTPPTPKPRKNPPKFQKKPEDDGFPPFIPPSPKKKNKNGRWTWK